MCSLGRVCWTSPAKCVPLGWEFHPANVLLGSGICWTSSGKCVLGSRVCWTSSGKCVPWWMCVPWVGSVLDIIRKMCSWVRSLLDIIRRMCSLNWVKSVLDIIWQMCSFRSRVCWTSSGKCVPLGQEFAGQHLANVFLRLGLCRTSSSKCVP